MEHHEHSTPSHRTPEVRKHHEHHKEHHVTPKEHHEPHHKPSHHPRPQHHPLPPHKTPPLPLRERVPTWMTAAFVVVTLLLLVNFGMTYSLSNKINAISLGGVTGAVITGGGDGTVTIIEYSDFECPFCGRAATSVDQVLDTYGDKINFEYKHFPLSQIHPNAQKAAEASECARDQGKFKEYHDVLFQNQGALTNPSLKQYATRIGLDTTTFNTCLDTGAKASTVEADFNEGRARGVSGTPTFYINGVELGGAQPFENFKTIIDQQLVGGAPAPSGAAVAPTPTTPPARITNVDVAGEPFKGVANAKVTIVEWSDFECPFCERFYGDAYKQILEAYPNDVKIVYRHFPLSFHPNAQKAAEASECAEDQDKFWEFHDKLFEEGVTGGVAGFKQYAKDLGLNSATFDACLDSGEKASEVAADMTLGQESGVTGTPGFLVNGIIVKGAVPFANFKTIIDAELAK